MSSTKSPNSSRGGVSKAIPQGTFKSVDPMYQMHMNDPKTQQSPDRTLKQLQVILNPSGADGSVMKKQAAMYNKGRP